MLFNSFEFLLFLPTVFLLYWFVFRERRVQNMFIVVCSYIFYGWWDWKFLFLIAFTSLCSYISGILIERHDGRRQLQQCISASNIIINLIILGVFKYYNFFVDNIAVITRSFGHELDWPTLNIVLPVGISFYTFQALSYTIDVYRGNIRATHDPIEFFAYISFFPQLVAGPIERATNLLPQFQSRRSFDYGKAVDGCRQMLWGFFKKMVVADNCAIVVNKYWDSYDMYPGAQLLVVAVLFSFQIYCDFSGYSDIAIGSARLLGFNLKRNFHYPYFSRDISEFWRRWHISLMTWFRDYIYFPLGGSRCSRAKVIRNTVIVFLVSGLWHGSDWTFVIWGLYHALLIALFMTLGLRHKYEHVAAYGKKLPSLKELSQIMLTFLLVVVGWIIFRSEDMVQAAGFLSQMLSPTLLDFIGLHDTPVLFYCLAVIIIEWIQRDKEHALDVGAVKSRFTRYAIYTAVVYAIYVYAPKEMSEFIYFQF